MGSVSSLSRTRTLSIGLGFGLLSFRYGIVLWELLHRRTPWEELVAAGQMRFVRDLTRALEDERRPLIDPVVEVAQPGTVHLMRSCWASDPTSRPAFLEICFWHEP